MTVGSCSFDKLTQTTDDRSMQYVRHCLREVSFKKKHFDGYKSTMGRGGVSVQIHFSRICFTVNVNKICLNIGKER